MPERGARRWLLRAVLLLGALVAGAGCRRSSAATTPWPALQPAPAAADSRRSCSRFATRSTRTRLALRLATARSQELERQVDALNQRLRESTEELTFFRKAREGKH